MIRDPSDGTVRAVQSSTEPSEAPIGHPAGEFAEAIRAAILAGKVRPERMSAEWVYQRAWNDGIDFTLGQIARVEKQLRSTESGEG